MSCFYFEISKNQSQFVTKYILRILFQLHFIDRERNLHYIWSEGNAPDVEW